MGQIDKKIIDGLKDKLADTKAVVKEAHDVLEDAPPGDAVPLARSILGQVLADD